MYNWDELNKLTKNEIKAIASDLGIAKISVMKKLDMINAILEAQSKKKERPQDVVEMTGVLEVKGEGYGFLRFDNFQYFLFCFWNLLSNTVDIPAT